MLKKNTRKRLLAGALATVMMLTMCPSWALADDEGIATLPANEEIAVPVDDSIPAADTTKTPADPTPSVPEAKPAEDQDPAPAPSNGGANGGTDSTESGNSTNPTVSKDSENNSQNNDVVSNSPENEISTASLDAVPYGWNDVKTIEAEYWITNLHAEDDNGSWKLSIDKDTVGEDGKSVAELAPPERRATADETYNTVFWQARVLHWYEHQTTLSNADKTQSGTEITSIRYKNDRLEYCAKDSSDWTAFARNDQLVFYYLIRTEYSQMVQIDVSDWTVDTEQKLHPNRRSVTYQVYVKGGNEDGTDKPAGSRTFWYNKAFKVSSVRVREIGDYPNYSIDHVELEPSTLGDPIKNENGEYRFSLDLTKAKRDEATVKIYVKPNVDPHQLTYNEDGGTITSEGYTVGSVYPQQRITVPEVEKEGHTFDGWFDENNTKYETGALMPDKNLTLTAHWTANTPTPPVEPETKTPAMYFVLLPNRGVPKSGESQGWTNYLPNVDSDGGVMGLTRETGYKGHLTEEGKEAANKGEFNANGVDPSYLIVPSDLGFFTRANWSEDGKTYKPSTNVTDIKALLGANYNPTIAKVVWYTVKHDDTDGYHVDGYVKNVDVNVTYHSNFGDAEQTKICTATTGEEYEALSYAATELPDRANYTFGGWYTNQNCAEETAYETDTLMTSLDLYAKWVPNNFGVSYFYQNEQGKETQFGDIDTYAFDTDVTVRTAHPEKAGYTFTGWTNIANIVTVDADGKFTMPAQDVRFDAQFSINQYHVTYKVDGKDYGNTETYVFNSDVAIRPVPTKEGYTFSGWTSDDSAFDIRGFKMPAHDVTIEGTFAINRYTVTYKVDTEVVGTDVYDFNSDVVIRPVPTKEGYTFSGWKIGTADAENFKMPAHDVTIEGTFAKNSSGGHHHRKPTVTIPDKVPTGLNGNDHYAYIVGYPDKTVRPQNGITRAEVATIFFRLLTDETRNANSTKSNSYSDVAAGAWYNHAVSTLSAMGIVKGDSQGKFNPNAPITRAEFAAIAARFDDKANTTAVDFSDIASHWAKDEISAAANNGWINGYTDGTFRPNNKITRAEAMTLVNRVLKRLPETAKDLHNDMIKWSDNSDTSAWYYLAVQEATNSHYYGIKENKHEKWSKLRETRDWTELEK